MDEKAKPYVELFKQMGEDRTSWESLWQDGINYILPRKGYMTSSTSNKPTDASKPDSSKIFNNTATTAVRRLAAGMQSGLTSPMRPWFRISLADPDLADRSTVKAWLQAIEKRMYIALAKGGFYAAVHALFTELAVFGNGCLWEGEDPATTINFRPLTIGEYSLAQGPSGTVDTVARMSWWTAKEMVQQWGEGGVPRRVRDLATTRPGEYSKILHVVRPRKLRDTSQADAKNMPFESVWVSYDDQEILGEGGFRVLPYLVSRWDVTGSEVYGRGQAEDLMPDIKMLQELEKTQLKSLHLMAQPPLMAPLSLMQQAINTFPGGVTYTDNGAKEAFGPLYQVNFDVKNVQAKIETLETKIGQGFFNDVFLMLLQRPNMTATEVMERSEEKILMLGPVIERQQTELLDPVISRTFDILWNKGRNAAGEVVIPEDVLLPDPPQEIQGAPLKVEYIGLLSQAQRMAGADGLNRFMSAVGPLFQLNPNALDKVDVDQVIEEYASLYNIPAEIVKSEEDVQAARQARAQVQQKQQQQTEMEQNAKTAQQLSQADLGGNNALAALVAQQTGQAPTQGGEA